MSYDLIVIGSGPGGYTGAIRGAQLGLKTAIIEKDKTLGGTCLNVGCIPSKALLDSSEHFSQAQHEFDEHGIEVGNLQLNVEKMMARKGGVVSDLTKGIEYLMGKNKIDIHKGVGKILNPNEVLVTNEKGETQTLQAKNIMLATGSIPVELPFLKFDEKQILSSTGALSLKAVPKHLIVIGGGVIGLELGSVWLRLGAKVTVIEFADSICGGMDKNTSKQLLRTLKKQGFDFLLQTKVTGAEISGDEVKVNFESLKDGKTDSITGDKVLVSVGRKPYSEGLGLEEVGIQKDDRGCVQIDDHFRTTIPHIFAIGDLVRGPMLAHKAEEEGVAVAETIVTGHGHVNYDTVPSVIYTWPEVASVGQTEEQLKEKGIAYNVGAFPFTANGRAKALGCTDGSVRILADKTSDKVLGVHIVGPRASDILCEAVVAMEFGGSSEDIARSFHAHPTLTEVIREAALAVDKRARQM